MDICEDNDIPVILGRPFMLTASYIVDMGRKKLELGFEDQKIILIYLSKTSLL